MKRYILIISLVLCAVVSKAQVSVEATLDSTAILVGSQTNLTVEVKGAAGGAKIDFPYFKDESEIAQGIEMVRLLGDTTADKSKRVYVLTAWNEGKYSVPSLSVKVNGKNYQTNAIPLQVNTIKVDTARADSIRPMRGVVDNPYSWEEWSPLFWLSIAVLLLLVVIYYLYVRLRDNKAVLPKIRFVKRLLPHERALQEIERIKAANLSESADQKAYYTELTDVLRQYLEDRFGIKAKEMTSSEILYRLEREDDKDKIDELRNVFETADLVKFAKYSVQNDANDAYMQSVVEFIDNTKQENAPTVEKTANKLSATDKKNIRTRKGVRASIAVLVIAVVAIVVYIIWRAVELLS